MGNSLIENIKNNLWFWSGISISIFLLLTAFFASRYTSTDPRQLPPDQASQDRLTTVSEAFSSLLGRNWPYVLFMFTLFIFLALYLFYLSSRNENVVLTLSDGKAHTLIIILAAFLVLSVVVIIVLLIKSYRNYTQSQSTGNIPNYEPSEADKQKTRQLLMVIGFGLFAVLLGIFSVWYFFYHSPKNPNT